MTEKDKDQPWESSGNQPASHSSGPVPRDEDHLPLIEMSHEARNMAMLCHILGVAGFFAPLVIWLSERDKHKFVNEHGRAAMDYQISLIVYYAIASLLCVVPIGFVLVWVLTIVHIALIVIGAVKASRGERWRYPIAIQFLK
jgi:uncharacterized Tic20 family protein